MQNSAENKVLVAGHRGNSRYCPENTLSSFRSALACGVDMLEIDLHMTADRQLILMHDHTVDRTTNGTGLIRDKTLAQIKALDAGAWKGEAFAGERVPTFVEFLEMVKDRKELLFNVELKDYPTKCDAAWAYESTDRAIALIDDYGISERSVINSWNGAILEYIDEKYSHRFALHGYHPFFQLGPITRDPCDYLYCVCLFNVYQDENGKRRVHEHPVAPKAVFDAVIARGIRPWVYNERDDLEAIGEAVAYGARLVTANDPAKVLDYLRNRGLHA